MGHSVENVNWTKVGLIVSVLLIGAWLALTVFNVSLSALGTLAFLGFFVWMHMGMHGGHGSHGSHGEEQPSDEHVGHTTEPARDGTAQAISSDANASRPAADGQAKPVASEEQNKHRGC